MTITDAMAAGGLADGYGGQRAFAGHRLRRQDGQRADHLQRSEEARWAPKGKATSKTTAGSSASRRAAIRKSWWPACLKAASTERLAARVASKVIKAYVEKQRSCQDAGGQGKRNCSPEPAGRSRRGVARGRRQDSRQDASRTLHGSNRWQDQAGSFGAGSGGSRQADSCRRSRNHRVARRDGPSRNRSRPRRLSRRRPATTPDAAAPASSQKKPAAEPTIAPAAAVVPGRQP